MCAALHTKVFRVADARSNNLILHKADSSSFSFPARSSSYSAACFLMPVASLIARTCQAKLAYSLPKMPTHTGVGCMCVCVVCSVWQCVHIWHAQSVPFDCNLMRSQKQLLRILLLLLYVCKMTNHIYLFSTNTQVNTHVCVCVCVCAYLSCRVEPTATAPEGPAS